MENSEVKSYKTSTRHSMTLVV